MNGDSVSLTSAADALRDEEVARSRLFILMGWVISVVALVALYFVKPPRVIAGLFVAGLVGGFFYSFFKYREFADPKKFTERALIGLCIVAGFNGHLGVLVFGVYSGAPVLIVVALHFIGRTEMAHVAKWSFISCAAAYTAMSALIIGGVITDPGVYASDTALPRDSLVAATVFVDLAYALAYYSARTFRATALTSIDELQRATRLASQREALMEELRADLERALHVGGPGRHTDREIGEFKLGIVLGRGAIGEVYEATHLPTGTAAAVKMLRREQLADPMQVARFVREVQLTSVLVSPHIVRGMGFAVEGEALPFLAMERISGQTLGEILRRAPRLSAQETLEVVDHAARGIDTAAATGIVHRDLKPQNLMRTDDGVWKILDFGVATLGSSSTGTLTQGGVVGTPHYMAPEQAQGKPVDTRADLYAIGAIAYRCLTGRHPFTAADTPALLYAIVHRAPAQPSGLVGVPPDVDRWFALALAKDPEDRFESGATLAHAFAAALTGELDSKLRKRADALIRKQPWEAV